MTKGLWLLPTKGRIPNLRRFLSAAREMGCSTEGWVLVNDDELETNRFVYEQAMRLAPKGWELKPVKATCYGDALRYVWDDVKELEWVGLVSDDLVPCTGNWDVALLRSLAGWNVVSSNDGWQSQTGNIHTDRLHGAIVFSGPLLRTLGFLFPPALTHIFHDDVIETIGRETNCWQIRTDVMVKHLHEALEGVRGPTMDPSSDLWKHDEAIFKMWLANDKDAIVARVRALMESYGLRAIKPDFTGVKLMIGTPCLDGRYDGGFMVSLWTSMQMMAASGVVCQMAEERFTADISLARAKLFSAFLRSDCTHLLTIDTDMSWGVDAIIRLFHAKKDFVSIAGPKKRYPLTFAANFTDTHGNPILLQFDNESGTMEVGEIGAAFCLITRACAQKMADAYPELAFVGISGEKEYAIYNPIVTSERGGRYYSEDFAFCLRWRTIGGKCFMIPDIKLSHSGHHTFTGSFSEVAFTQQKAAE